MLRNENVEVKGGSAGEREGGSKDPRGLKSACRLKPAPHVLGTIFLGRRCRNSRRRFDGYFTASQLIAKSGK
jgi:hypothetical protein